MSSVWGVGRACEMSKQRCQVGSGVYEPGAQGQSPGLSNSQAPGTAQDHVHAPSLTGLARVRL